MSEEWSDEAEAPRKKGGLPGWVWWTCGTGCVLVVLVAIAIGIGGYFVVQRSTDPEIVHPRLMKFLPCDEWPEGYSGTGFDVAGSGVYNVSWPGGMAMVQLVPNESELDKLFDPESTAVHMVEKDMVVGEADIQGRAVRTMFFKQRMSDIPNLRIDISGNLEPCAVLQMVGYEEEGADIEKARAFLEPFDVWRGKD